MKYQPIHAYVVITQACNLKCQHCIVTHKNNKISFDFFKQIIQKYKSINSITLFGGQPLLQHNSDIVLDIITYCKSNNIQISVTTNLAYQLTQYHMEVFAAADYISTSWNYNRFSIQDYEIWKNNLQILAVNGYQVGGLITLTEDLIINITPQDAYNLFETFKLKDIKFQPFIGHKNISNRLIDKWLTTFYNLSINSDKYIFFKYIQNSIKANKPCNIFDRNCSKNIITLYPDQTLKLCPYHFLDPANIDKLQNLNKNYQYKCLMCEFKPICQGSCILLQKSNDYCNGYPLLFKSIKQKL